MDSNIPLRKFKFNLATGSENVGVLAGGPPIRLSSKMSVLIRLKFNKVSFDVWKVGFTPSVSLMFVTGKRSWNDFIVVRYFYRFVCGLHVKPTGIRCFLLCCFLLGLLFEWVLVVDII